MNTVFFSTFFQSTLSISKCDIKDFLQIGAPVILTVITIVLSIGMHYGNKKLQQQLSDDNDKLQKQLYDREVENQTRELMINIYQTFLIAHRYVEQYRQVEESIVFWSWKFSEGLNNNYSRICDAFFQFKLLNECTEDDEIIKDKMLDCINAYSTLNRDVNNYLSSMEFFQHRDEGWRAVWSKYNINYYDYDRVFYNIGARRLFAAQFNDNYMDTIRNDVEKIRALFNDEYFEKFFAERVKIKKCSDNI